MWDVESGQAICGSPTNYDFTLSVKFLNNRNDSMVTAGSYNLKVRTTTARSKRVLLCC